MEEHGYPEYEAHKQEHEELAAKVLDFKRKFDEGQAAIVLTMLGFLKDWLTSHILEVDKRYENFFRQSGVK